MSDDIINGLIAAASGVFFATIVGICRTAGADLWAAVVIGLAAVAALLLGSSAWARRSS